MYKVEIVEASKEFTKKEAVALKTAAFESLDKLAPISIVPVGFAALKVTNDESAENPEYTKFVIIADGGKMYATGSAPFWRQFRTIFDEMNGETDWAIEVIKQDSRKREGKYFLSCVLV